MVFQGRPFFGADILAIGELAAAGDWESGEGTSEQVDIVHAYVDRLVNGFAGGACRIGWDPGNGAPRPVIEKLPARLARRHHILLTDLERHFPTPHPASSEERRVGKGCVPPGSTRLSPYHIKQTIQT